MPIAGAALVATKFAADFEKSTTKLVTLSGVSEQQMNKMRDAVLALAPTVGIGPRALSEALLVVTSTGFEGAAAMEILELAAKSSAIGMGDTKDVARALTAAVSAYGSENLTAAQAADILHATVVAGGAEATELAGELGRVVGIASQLGVSFSEVGAFIATYTRLGLSAAEATTGLSGALNTILSPSREAREALENAGLSADTLRQMVSEKGLGAALTTLLVKLGGNADAIGAVFGNVRALAGVMGTAGVQADNYAKVLAQITNSTGNLNTAFEQTKKTFAFQWDQFKAQAERAAITLGTQLLPAIERILIAASPLANMVVGMIGWFSNLPAPIQTAALAFLGLVAAIGPITYAVSTVTSTFGALVGLLRTMGLASIFISMTPAILGATEGVLGFAAAVLAIPGVQVAAALAIILAGFVLLIPKIYEAIQAMGLWNAIKQGASGAAGALIPGIGGGLSPHGGTPRPGFGSKGQDILLATDPVAAMQKQMAAMIGGGGGVDKKAAKEAKRAAEEWKKFHEDMFGNTAIEAAQNWMDHLGDINNLQFVSVDKQAQMNSALAEALAVYGRLGIVAPAAWNEVYLATMKVQEVTSGLGNLVNAKGELQLGEAMARPFTDAMIPNLGVTSGLAGLNMPGATGMPSYKPASFMQQMLSGFGGMKNFGADLSKTVMGALQGGGDVGGAVGGLLGGKTFEALGGKLSSMFGKTGIGGLLGGALGAALPGIGSIVGSMIGQLGKLGGAFAKLFGKGDDGDKQRDAFLKQMGGFDALAKKMHEIGPEADAMFKALSGAKNGKEAEAAINNITAALDKQKKALDAAMTALPEGANARSKNISGQADFNVVGAEALGSFAFLVSQGQTAMQAFAAITPAVTAMKDAFALNNLEMTGAAERLFSLSAIMTANKVQFDNVSASGSILSAMLQANIKDLDLFNAVAGDIGLNIQKVIDSGVPMAQVFALAQPQLQALWEAEQKWGFQVDANTQSLIDQAAQQGFVGEQMKSVNQQILDVLVAIGKALGADIPNAMAGLPGAAAAAAAGMNAAFAGVSGPNVNVSMREGSDAPQMREGGIVNARPGGTLVNVGEGGRPEAIIPLGGRGGGSMASTVIIEVDGRTFAEVVVPHIPGVVQRYGLA